MVSLTAGPTKETQIKEDENKQEVDQANLILAVKSTPSLNQAFKERVKAKSRATSNYFTANNVPTGPSELDDTFK